MVIDKEKGINSDEKLEKLIEIKDDKSLINEDYESYIYYSNVIIKLIKEMFSKESLNILKNKTLKSNPGQNNPINQKSNCDLLNNYLDTIIPYITNINKLIINLIKSEKDSLDNLKLISYNINEKSKELNKTFSTQYDLYVNQIKQLDLNEQTYVDKHYINIIKNKIMYIVNYSNQMDNDIIRNILALSGNHLSSEEIKNKTIYIRQVNYNASMQSLDYVRKFIIGMSVWIFISIFIFIVYRKFALN